METRKAHDPGRTGLSSDSESLAIKRKYRQIPVHKVQQRYQSFLTRNIILLKIVTFDATFLPKK
jgi:hypothetical protein